MSKFIGYLLTFTRQKRALVNDHVDFVRAIARCAPLINGGLCQSRGKIDREEFPPTLNRRKSGYK